MKKKYDSIKPTAVRLAEHIAQEINTKSVGVWFLGDLVRVVQPHFDDLPPKQQGRRLLIVKKALSQLLNGRLRLVHRLLAVGINDNARTLSLDAFETMSVEKAKQYIYYGKMPHVGLYVCTKENGSFVIAQRALLGENQASRIKVGKEIVTIALQDGIVGQSRPQLEAALQPVAKAMAAAAGAMNTTSRAERNALRDRQTNGAFEGEVVKVA